ncbi:uncharacterized protein LOC144476268 isoform X2 [Augochlora pura]
MTGSRLRPAFFVGLFVALLAVALQGVQSEEELEVPPEDLCRPYIEKALKDLGTGSLEQTSAEAETDVGKGSQEDDGTPASQEEGEPTADLSGEDLATEEDKQKSAEDAETAGSAEQTEEEAEKSAEADKSAEDAVEQSAEAEGGEAEGVEKSGEEDAGTEEDKEQSSEKVEESADSGQDQAEEEDQQKSGEGTEEETDDQKSEETQVGEEKSGEEDAQADDEKSEEAAQADEGKSDEGKSDDGKSDEEVEAAGESAEEAKLDEEKSDEAQAEEVKSEEEKEGQTEEEDSKAEEGASTEEGEVGGGSEVDTEETKDDSKADDETQSEEQQVSGEEGKDESQEGEGEGAGENEGESKGGSEEGAGEDEGESSEGQVEEAQEKESEEGKEEEGKSAEDEAKSAEEGVAEETKSEEEKEAKSAEEDKSADDGEGKESVEETKSEEGAEETKSRARREVGEEGAGEESAEASEDAEQSEEEPTPEEDLIREIVVPENLRPRDHINQLLKLDEENEAKERAISKIGYDVLKELKRVYDNAIQPLESLYKYRDLSNRHFGDPEIFSKPLVLFMGPWSGGKSSIINYLLDIEYEQTSLRTECLEEQCKTGNGNDTGAEPSPAYFNILMHGEEEEVLDGTQLAADWTFSGLQKFGQGLLDRLKGLRLDSKLLEKVNIVEIPGILEIRKQVQRLFPFNDACQWFIDRADIIFLVYDPSKLDVGPETEAILDQLKGREYQTRIILNKADQVKPEELMRVQGALIWNISPLMSSAEPPIMYSTSLWSIPYEAGAPTRLLYAQERAFLRDLRTAIDKQVEHKIASARRFAVRVRNHAKMVDCYLTTYYNHKTFFGNKKEISDKIVENPQDYHIYEGLSTLKNISRYDLPDPDVYRDFFRLNPLYDFPLLSSTCTYFRGCPINRLDVAIAYDLPELVGKYKKSVEQVIHEYESSPPS